MKLHDEVYTNDFHATQMFDKNTLAVNEGKSAWR